MERILVELEEAVTLILDRIKEIDRTEVISVREANGRILAEDIYSPLDNPPFHRSPLDGFALRSIDLVGASKENPKVIQIVEVLHAGNYSERVLQEGEGVRIMTGAPVPQGADCVIRLEDIKDGFNKEKDEILVEMELKKNENICFQGEDVEQGALVLKKGIKLSYVEQGVLSSMGFHQVKVYEKVKAAVFTSGDELVAPGDCLTFGKIYDSNLILVTARLQELGVTPVITEYLPDSPKEAAKAIQKSCKEVDLVITTGGVSVGDKDIFHEVLKIMNAEKVFWKVRLKPGTPAIFSMYEGKPMFHLSGNPFAAAATFEVLVRPALAKVTRNESLCLRKKTVLLEDEFIKMSKVRRMVRGKVEDGNVFLPSSFKHSSGMLASMSGCNCLLDIPAGSGRLEKGSKVEVLLL